MSAQCYCHIETIQMISNATQLNGFYMSVYLALYGFEQSHRAID